MGLVKSSSAVYLSIFEGKICQRVLKPTETSRSRVNKNNETVHEEVYGKLCGRITSIDTRDHETYGTQILVYVEDDQIYCLQFLLDGQYGVSFMKTLPNVNLTKPVELIPSHKKENGKDKQTLFINQNGEALKFAFTKDHPGDMPDAKQVEFKGEMKWDFFAQVQWLTVNVLGLAQSFLKNRVIKEVEVPKPEALPEKTKGGKKGKDKDIPAPEGDDLPF